MLSYPTLERTREAGKKRSQAEDLEVPAVPDQSHRQSGVFRGVLFALPVAGLLWALIMLAARALLRLL